MTMKKTKSLIAISLLAATAFGVDPPAKPTALDRYVAAPDEAFTHSVVSDHEREGLREIVVEFTSQTWRTTADVDRTLWKHWLSIVIPPDAHRDTAMLFISGGANDGEAPTSTDERMRLVALATQSIVVTLGQVPNQPLVFHNDGQQRYEDDLISYTWRKFIETGDDTWPAQLPMTKSAVRAMDVAQAVIAEKSGGQRIEHFVVAGASKRGWTTWLTAAVDPRVVAIAPIVIDVLNVRRSLRHHHEVYGFWAPAIGDYERAGLADELDRKECRDLLSIVDPYVYRTRFTLPKCIINASGDEFFAPDSSQFYFDRLPGEKHLCYVPNTGHSLKETNALDTLIAFHHSVLDKSERPALSWTPGEAGEWRLTSSQSPRSVVLWSANNPTKRDFRHEEIGSAYHPETLTANSAGEYVIPAPQPAQGWTAYFAQAEYDIGAARPWRISTPVWVVGAKE
jgi:PhoPQ-activated pathogenicity-related protein